MPTRLSGVTARTAAEIAPHVADLSPEGRAVLRPEHAPGEYLDALASAGHLPDAVRFLAHCLGRREAVWWACVCCRLAPDASPPPAAVAAFGSAEAWCYRPTEENRRAAYAAAEAAQFEHPAALAALGAFFSGGSLAPAHIQQPVPPGPFHTARAIAGSVLLSAVRLEPESADARLRLFLTKGIEVANSAGARTPARGGA